MGKEGKFLIEENAFKPHLKSFENNLIKPHVKLVRKSQPIFELDAPYFLIPYEYARMIFSRIWTADTI